MHLQSADRPAAFHLLELLVICFEAKKGKKHNESSHSSYQR